MKNKISKLLKRQVTLHENFGDASFSSDQELIKFRQKKHSRKNGLTPNQIN